MQFSGHSWQTIPCQKNSKKNMLSTGVQNISLTNRFSLLSSYNAIEQGKARNTKITTRKSRYTPTWLENRHVSQKEVPRNVKVKAHCPVVDINLREISFLSKLKSSVNISSMARKRAESLERKLKAHHQSHVVKIIQKSTHDVEYSGKDIISSIKSREMEMKSEKKPYVHTCQTLRAFLKSKRYSLRDGIPIPYKKLIEKCENDNNLLETPMKYLNNIVYHIVRIEMLRNKNQEKKIRFETKGRRQ